MPCVFPLLLLNGLLIYLLTSGLCFFQREKQAIFHLLKDCLRRLLLCCAELGWNSRRWAHFSSRSSDLNSSNSLRWFCTQFCWTVLKICVNLLMTNPLLPQKYFQGQLHVLSCFHRERIFSLFCCFKANEPSLSRGQSHHLTKPYPVVRNSVSGKSCLCFTAEAPVLQTVLPVVLSASILSAFGAVETWMGWLLLPVG